MLVVSGRVRRFNGGACQIEMSGREAERVEDREGQIDCAWAQFILAALIKDIIGGCPYPPCARSRLREPSVARTAHSLQWPVDLAVVAIKRPINRARSIKSCTVAE